MRDEFSRSGLSGFASTNTTRECLVDFRASSAAGGRPSDRLCTFGDRHAEKVVVLYGDSHASMWLPAMDRLGRERHFRVVLVARASCAIASISQWIYSINGPSIGCDRWKVWARQHINALHPSAVVVSDDANGFQHDVHEALIPQATYADAETHALDEIRVDGRSVIVIGRTPTMPGSVPTCLGANPGSIRKCGVSTREYHQQLSRLERRAVERSGASFVSPERWLCTRKFCPAIVDSTVVYADSGHLTRTYVLRIAAVVGSELRAAGL